MSLMEPSASSIWKTGTLPQLSEVLAHSVVVQIPMRVKFRGVHFRQTMLFEGESGWGEFAPFLEYPPEEAAYWLSSALESAWLGFPEPIRSTIPVNSTLPAVDAGQVPAVLGRYQGKIREVKIKVAERGQSLAEDIARISAVHRYVPDARLKVDANGGWSTDEAFEAIQRLEEFDVLYVEQPVQSVDEMARLHAKLREQGVGTLIAADESVRKAQDPLQVAERGAADVLILKAAPLGGVRRALEVCEQAGLPVVVSSALESSVGIRSGIALAASLPELPFGCGLGTVSLMSSDVTRDSLCARDGVIPVRDVEVDKALVSSLSVDEDVRRWWHERVRRCYRVLEERL
ncbi:o-succinylbenzoate synthase [Rothia sp. P6271]|uniref:o-succinylbenzoate synthase n=1 Tax=Rothia sp. P6271 TaxID=3402659 RepID=UPI003AC73679